MIIPDPELALFKHKLPAHVFFETVQLARRWTGPDAAEAGIVSKAYELGDLLPMALEKAASLAHLGNNRRVYGTMKERLFWRLRRNQHARRRSALAQKMRTMNNLKVERRPSALIRKLSSITRFVYD